MKRIKVNCPMCNAVSVVDGIEDERATALETGGIKIINLFPDLLPEDREVLISGLCASCQRKQVSVFPLFQSTIGDDSIADPGEIIAPEYDFEDDDELDANDEEEEEVDWEACDDEDDEEDDIPTFSASILIDLINALTAFYGAFLLERPQSDGEYLQVSDELIDTIMTYVLMDIKNLLDEVDIDPNGFAVELDTENESYMHWQLGDEEVADIIKEVLR